MGGEKKDDEGERVGGAHSQKPWIYLLQMWSNTSHRYLQTNPLFLSLWVIVYFFPCCAFHSVSITFYLFYQD